MTKKEIKVEELPNNSMTKKIGPIRPQSGGDVKPKVRRRKRAIVQAQRRKRGLVGNVAAALFNDGSNSIGQYILNEVVIPTVKTMIEDGVKGAIDMVLYNGTGHRSSSRDRDSGNSRVSYGSYYKGGSERRERRGYGRGDRFNLNEIFFKRGDDADDVLSALCDELEEYESVSVATFFDIAGINGATWTHNKWGWTDLSKAYCTHTRDGYMIVFPDPEELDD